MASHDTLIEAAAVQRMAWARMLDTPRSRFMEMQATLAKLNVPPPMTLYDSRADRAWVLQRHIEFERAVIEAVKTMFERLAADTADYCGARAEDVALFDGALSDFTAPTEKAIEELLEPVELAGRK